MWSCSLLVLSLSCMFAIAAGCEKLKSDSSKPLSVLMLYLYTLKLASIHATTITHHHAEYYRDCKEALTVGEKLSGVYTIKPDRLPPFQVSSIFLIFTLLIP